MKSMIATAVAHPNIALIKYWGNRNDDIRLPSNGSISMNLAALLTKTCVEFNSDIKQDELFINSHNVAGEPLDRVTRFLNLIRDKSRLPLFARVISENNFPIGAGIASSASAFGALSLACATATGLKLTEKELSILARHGSGSACRSIPTGFVEWLKGTGNGDSYAYSIAEPDHWDLVDIIAIVDQSKKKMGSSEGHKIAGTSPFQEARISNAQHRLDICRKAIQERDFASLTDIIELDSNVMHAVMMTSNPKLYYLSPASLHVMLKVIEWRTQGIEACFTLDAGPNVHILSPTAYKDTIVKMCGTISPVTSVLISPVGTGAELLS